eukprot:TRINITY_DN56215_c0_g1_i1.p2 TRINITY_DN56215_c0_g1~~TRINITY_DN56215_c0_g1_i1.p2  ORF type:complete len:309 (+),score=146.20 TRINITY_DN56215_c0_g1_i1:91-927(+)
MAQQRAKRRGPGGGAAAGLPTGRVELLAWVNDFAQTDYSRIEQCADAVVYAHIADAAHEGRFPLQRLNLAARNEEEYTRNLTVLQQEFKKLRIDRLVPVDRLAKGRFQDNNEFLQWCYVYLYSSGVSPEEYDAPRRREEALARQQRARQLQRGALPPPLCKPELLTALPGDAEGSVLSDPAAGGPGRRYDPAAYTSAAAGLEEPADPLALAGPLCEELCRQREAQLRRRRQLAELERERNGYWQQLRTVEELINTFASCPSTAAVADVLFEPDSRLAS